MRSKPWLEEGINRYHEEIEHPRHWSVVHELHGMKGRHVAVKYDIGNDVAKKKAST